MTVPLLMLFLFIVTLGLNLFTQTSMDIATLSAARQIQIGAQRGTSDSGIRSIICGQMGGVSISCSNLRIYVTSGPSFSTLAKAAVSNGTLTPTGFAPGGALSFVLVQVAYPASNVFPFMPTPPVFVSSAIFQNET